MTKDQKTGKGKPGLREPARQPGNLSLACKLPG